MSPSVQWADVLVALTRSILRTAVCGELGTELKKRVAVAIILL